MTKKRTLAILNLSGEFPSELANYFSSREIQVINPLNDSTKLEWTHIFTKDVHDFSVVAKTHQTLEKDIHIISLSKVLDLREFVLAGGKMIFDEQWLSGSMGGFILDKFFQEYAGINIDDNYPNFQEVGSFKITNPFSTGEYLDRMVFNAFEKGMNALAIKTYFDHLLMYLAGLKNKGRVGIPIEVSYGTLNEVFGVQLHFFAQDLSVDDITMSLSNSITKKPEEYLLNISIQSADFFDFTYLTGVNKVVITGLWSADQSIKVDNRGLMFTNLSPSAKIGSYPSQLADSFVIHDEVIEDMSPMVNLPDPDLPVAQVETEFVTDLEEETVNVIGPADVEEEAVTTVSGGAEEDESSQVVKGSKEEQDKFSQRIKGEKKEKDNFSQKISGGKEDDGKGKFNVRSLGGADSNARSGQFDFTSMGGSQPKEGSSGAAANPFFKPQTSEKEKELEEKLRQSVNDNERLKTKLKLLASELENNKNNRAIVNDIKLKKDELESLTVKGNSDDDEMRKLFQQKLSENRQLSPQEMKRLNSLLERESKYLEDAKQNELNLKKLQLEAAQKEMVFTQELEKAQRASASREVIIEKTKEAMTRVIEKKDAELLSMKDRFEQVNKVLANGPNQAQQTLIRDLEKQNLNLNKMLEVYKNKVTMLATNMESNKGDDSNFKDEARRLSLLTVQLKTMAETSKKEADKLKERSAADMSLIANLRQEKTKLEQMLKKAATEVPKAQVTANIQAETELRKFQQQNQVLEVQLRETGLKVKDLEKRLVEALKNSKTTSGAGVEDSSKKVVHLEASMKKLTGDLMASQNQTAEMKKDVNKLRSENQALQNQLAQAKKELEKLKPAAPKTPGNGGKAA